MHISKKPKKSKKSKKIIIKPLKISNYIKNELSSKFLLLYTGISRGSEKVIETQIQNIENNDKKGIKSLLKLKKNTLGALPQRSASTDRKKRKETINKNTLGA